MVVELINTLCGCTQGFVSVKMNVPTEFSICLDLSKSYSFDGHCMVTGDTTGMHKLSK